LRLTGYKRLLIINTLLVGLSLWSFMLINAQSSIYLMAGLTFIFGFLISMQFSGMNSMAYAEITTEQMSSASSIMGTLQQLAQSFGVAMSAILIRVFSPSSLVLSPQVFHHVFFALGIITFLSSVIFCYLKKDDGMQMLKRNLAPV